MRLEDITVTDSDAARGAEPIHNGAVPETAETASEGSSSSDAEETLHGVHTETLSLNDSLAALERSVLLGDASPVTVTLVQSSLHPALPQAQNTTNTDLQSNESTTETDSESEFSSTTSPESEFSYG